MIQALIMSITNWLISGIKNKDATTMRNKNFN